MVLEMVQIRISTGVTRVVYTAMWKANGNTSALSFFLNCLFPNAEIPYIRDVSSGLKILRRLTTPLIRYPSRRVSKGNVMKALRKETFQRADGTSQLRHLKMESKDLKSRRQFGESENGNTEE